MITCPTKNPVESYAVLPEQGAELHWVKGPDGYYGPFDSAEEVNWARERLELLNQAQF